MQNKIHIIYGPTASGKTEFSVNLAKKLGNAEIINADSMQIYKEIPIITNQPTEAEKQNIPHHLFSVKSILEHSDMSEWLEIAVPLIKNILSQNKTPILVGGTGMYLKALVEGISSIPPIPFDVRNNLNKLLEESGIEHLYAELKKFDPQSAEKIKPNDTTRIIRALEVIQHTKKSIQDWNKIPNKIFFPQEDFKVYFLNKNRDEIYNKINRRFENMVENGLLEEAERASGLFVDWGAEKIIGERGVKIEEDIFTTKKLPSPASKNSNFQNLPAHKAHGLREIISYLSGEISKEKAIELAQQATRNYAKRQFTWWRGWVKTSKNLDFEEVI